MPPKKKGNKKAQQDDWEADMGESIVPQDAVVEEPKAEAEAAPADEEAAGGGLMAALQRRGKKKKNKTADFELEGEDPTVEAAEGADTSLDSKAPQEATFDDDDEDVFAGNYGKKKAKGGGAEKKEEAQEEQPEPADDTGRVKTKAEKEKEKKEKEKQRKKELVCTIQHIGHFACSHVDD